MAVPSQGDIKGMLYANTGTAQGDDQVDVFMDGVAKTIRDVVLSLHVDTTMLTAGGNPVTGDVTVT